MPNLKLQILIVLFLATGSLAGFAQLTPRSKQIIADAQKTIKAYHADAPKTNNVVKVVYFHGRDRQPLANWEARLDRVLSAVNDFYKEEFKSAGLDIDGVNFEKAGKKYAITVIKGDMDSKAYDANSGPQIQAEMRRKAADKIDVNKDHVLVLTGLTYIREDSVIVFHSPYNGMGSSERGICYASDSEMLDPKYLTDKATRMRFSERPGWLKDCLVAEFNSWYIGGIAHEMGHMFGLAHDFGNPAELTPSTISLMGEYGSRHFKDYLWQGKQTAHLSAAGILQLASHPVFTRSRKQINTHPRLALGDIKFQNLDSSILMMSDLQADEVPYALTLLIHSTASTDYYNESTIYPITAMGPINIPLKKWPEGVYRMAMIFMFPNGTQSFIFKSFSVSDNGVTLVDPPEAGGVNKTAYYDKLSKGERTPLVNKKLKILEGIIKAAGPVNADTYEGNRLYLSDAKWEVGNVGWEKPARNYYSTESESVFFLENQGQLFEKGIFAHSPSLYKFRLNKKWKRFSAIVGLRDGANAQQGSAIFTIIAGGKVLYESDKLVVGQRANINIDITNVDLLELRTEGTESHNFNSWAVWLDPLVER